MDVSVLHSFFLHLGFVPLGFTSKIFNEAVLTNFLRSNNGHSKRECYKESVNDNQFTK